MVKLDVLPEFFEGDPVEKYTGEARYSGVIVAKYLTTKQKRRYVVEVSPQGFQMICSPEQLRHMRDNNGARSD